MAKRLGISKGGQVSVPAAVRRRWGTRTVLAEDRGDHLVLRPAPDDPIAAAAGAFADQAAGSGLSGEEIRKREREEESAGEDRRTPSRPSR